MICGFWLEGEAYVLARDSDSVVWLDDILEADWLIAVACQKVCFTSQLDPTNVGYR